MTIMNPKGVKLMIDEYCKDIIWSYNMIEHYKFVHNGFDLPDLIIEEEKIAVLNFKLWQKYFNNNLIFLFQHK